MTNNNPLFYEQGTGKIGDATNLVFIPEPPFEIEHLYTSESTGWEYMNGQDNAGNSVEFADIIEAVRRARDGLPQDTEALDRILAVLDPGDSIAFEPEDVRDLGAGYLDGARS